jgi:hypothetical protein
VKGRLKVRDTSAKTPCSLGSGTEIYTEHKRKNWLFANTPAGAQSSSVIYSLIETAKENALDPYRYLVWILQEAPKLAQRDTAWAKHFLPCAAPESCKANN